MRLWRDDLGENFHPDCRAAPQACKRMRTEHGGYRRDHLSALARRVEVDVQELRIVRSKSELLRTLVAFSSAKTAGF